MPDDDFSFDDNGQGDDNEFSLDDFFGGDQKEEVESAAPSQDKPSGGGPSIDDFFGSAEESQPEDSLPMDRDEVVDSPPSSSGREEAPAPDPFSTSEAESPEPDFSQERTEPPPEEAAGEEGEETAGRGFFAQNWLFLLIGVLAVLVVGTGGFLGYNFLFGNGEKPVARGTAPAAVDKDKDKKDKDKQAASAGKDKKDDKKAPKSIDAGSQDKKSPVKKGIVNNKKSARASAGTVKSSSKDKDKAEPKTDKQEPKKQEPKESPSNSGHDAVASTGGPYTVQVARYMMDASKKGPESRLKKLGYSDYHYVKQYSRLWVHNVYAGKNLSRKEAEKMVDKLKDMGYAPQLERDHGGYKVLVYSYGSKSVANSTRRKVANAGLEHVRVDSERKKVALDQLRVGHFSSRYKARRAQRDLRRNGFGSAYVVRE